MSATEPPKCHAQWDRFCPLPSSEIHLHGCWHHFCSGRCLAHYECEPCQTCGAYIAAGL